MAKQDVAMYKQLLLFCLWLQFGFDGVFLGRIDYQDYNKRSQEKTLEHVWMGSESLGKNALYMLTIIVKTSIHVY